MKKEDSLMSILKETGKVATDINPKRLEEIRELHTECYRLQAIEDDLERKFNIASKKRKLCKEEMWDVIHESYDTIQNAIHAESHGATLEMDDNIIVFKMDMREDMPDDMPDGLKQMLRGLMGR